MKKDTQTKIWFVLRLSMAWIFLWAFFDKLFGWGFATSPEQSWLAGVSPTAGFLKFATKGPLAEFFQGLAGVAVVDWLFMLGLLGIGLALLLGVLLRTAGYLGALMMLLMWLAAMFPEHNPFMDDHIVYMIILIALAYVDTSKYSAKKWFK